MTHGAWEGYSSSDHGEGEDGHQLAQTGVGAEVERAGCDYQSQVASVEPQGMDANCQRTGQSNGKQVLDNTPKTGYESQAMLRRFPAARTQTRVAMPRLPPTIAAFGRNAIMTAIQSKSVAMNA